MWKWLKYGLLAWLALSVLTAPFYWPYLRMVWVFNPRVAAPQYEAPTSPVEARRQDLDYLSTLTRYDRAFSEDAKAAFAEAVGRISDTASDMSDAEFYLAIAEAVAMADNGHTNISYRPQYTEFNSIGARLYNFEDGTFIVSAAPDKSETLGLKVIGINGQPIDEIRQVLRRYRGGDEHWRDLYSTLIMESPDLLSAAGIGDDPASATFELETEAGERTLVVFDGLETGDASQSGGRAAWQTLAPGELQGIEDNWTHVLGSDGAGVPRYLSGPDVPLAYPLEANGHYIRALAGFDAGDVSINRAYREILDQLPEGGLDYLVVDFRLHDGGNYMKSTAFAEAAPQMVSADGEIYIVTGPNTFSAAIVTVAMLKYHSDGRAIIVGEPMGDRERFWAERGSSFQLPNSEYYINYATGLHDWESGCKGEPYCFTLNEWHEVPAGSLAPDTVVGQSFDSFRRSEDAVLAWVQAQQ